MIFIKDLDAQKANKLMEIRHRRSLIYDGKTRKANPEP